MACTARLRIRAVSSPTQPRRMGFNAVPLSVRSRCGTPWRAMPIVMTRHGVLGVLGAGCEGRDLQSGVIVVELEDRDDGATGEGVIGRVELPHLILGGVFEADEGAFRTLLRLRCHDPG